MAAKKTKGAPEECFAMTGKAKEITAFAIQFALLPRLWPFERTRVGKTSLM